jgi:hypothetical protein
MRLNKMHCRVKKYEGSPTVLVISKNDADGLNLKHGMIVDVPTIKVVKE